MSVKGFKINGVTHKFDFASLDNINILSEHISESAVTTPKLAPGAVTEEKLASGILSFYVLNSDNFDISGNQTEFQGESRDATESIVSAIGTKRTVFIFKYFGNEYLLYENYREYSGTGSSRTLEGIQFAMVAPDVDGHFITMQLIFGGPYSQVSGEITTK